MQYYIWICPRTWYKYSLFFNDISNSDYIAIALWTWKPTYYNIMLLLLIISIVVTRQYSTRLINEYLVPGSDITLIWIILHRTGSALRNRFLQFPCFSSWISNSQHLCQAPRFVYVIVEKMATDKIAKTVFADTQKEKLRSLVDNGIVNDVSKRNTNLFETTAAEMNLDPKSVRVRYKQIDHVHQHSFLKLHKIQIL